MSQEEKTRTEGSWFSRTNAMIGVVAALITLWGSWTTIRINQLSAQISRMKEERGWVEKIFDKFSDTVTREKLTPGQRLSALSGLLTLTELIDKEQIDVKTALTKSIRDQADQYRAELLAVSRVQTGDAKQQTDQLVAQAETIGNAAAQKRRTLAAQTNEASPAPAAPTVAGRASWSNYDFDIFWCETSSGAEARAQAVAALRDLDPNATGRWRVRRLSADINSRPGYGVKGLVVRGSAPDEKPLAEMLAERMQSAIGSPARVQMISYPTPFYLSAFVCD